MSTLAMAELVDLLLELNHPNGENGNCVDLRVEVDSDDTIAALTGALGRCVVGLGWGPLPVELGLARLRPGLAPGPSRATAIGVPELLDPATLVPDSGLVSGEAVCLVDGASGVPMHVGLGHAWFSLDVVAGPDAGRSISLPPGRYVVGRAPNKVADKVERMRAAAVGRVQSTVADKVERMRAAVWGHSAAGNAWSQLPVHDPSLSREHFALDVAVAGDMVVTPNPEAKTETAVEGGDALTAACLLTLGERIHAGRSVFQVRRVPRDETRRPDHLGQVPFNRVPYRRPTVTVQAFDELPTPPTQPTNAGLGLVAALTPAMSAAGMAVFTRNPYFLAMAGLTPLLLIWRGIASRRSGRKRFKRERAAFLERVDGRAAEVARAIDVERQVRLSAHPDLAELLRQARFHQPRLWERDRMAGDLLHLRLGLGELPSHVSTRIARGGDEELRVLAEERLDHQSSVSGVPITVDIDAVGTVGAWGEPAHVGAVGRSLVAQAACLHSPEDLVIAGAFGPSSLESFEWLKWLPHVRSTTSPLDGSHVVVGTDGTNRLLVRLLEVAASRGDTGGERAIWPRLLVVVDEEAEADRPLLSRLLDVAPSNGIHVLWLGRSDIQVPRQCRAVVHCPGPDRPGRIRYADPGLANREVVLDAAHPATARLVARSLAPLRDASAGNATTAIPRTVPLLDVLGFEQLSVGTVAARWQGPRTYALRFPIGVSVDGPFELDLVGQGPHSLIGGTSGAGKSELLQTMVLSLAASYSPRDVNFLFVDYKGGASTAAFRDLPHTVGYVTNLSGRLSMRALVSLRAELERRMRILEGRAKDLAEMLVVAPEDAPASLVIVVDEFAALVKEIPDFVAGIVDIAQRGRSLGVHLVLATQRPTGVVNENILANTALRISLRVLDAADSNNILGTRDAADIPVPLRGRALARTGPQALVPFQCAWSGAPYRNEGEVRTILVEPFVARPAARPTVDGSDTEKETADYPAEAPTESPTQLDVLVRTCAGAARQLRLPAARQPWVAPLAEVIPLDDLLDETLRNQLGDDPGRVAVLGRCDDPANQAQPVAMVDLEASGGLLVFGTGGSGKTTLLRTVALGMAEQGSADEVQLYAFDFASRSLDVLADIPHCAAVIPGDDEEQTTRVLTLLQREIDDRQIALATARAENLGALRRREGVAVYPRIILLLDSYSGFHSTFDRADRYPWLQMFQQVVSAGRQVGIHAVITTERRVGLPGALLAGISARMALRMSSPEDLIALGVHSKLAKEIDLPDGRGFLDGAQEVQVACVSADCSGGAQARTVGERAAALETADAARAPAPPVLPETVTLTASAHAPLVAPLGVADLTMDVVDVDLGRQNLVVAGPPASGRSCALATVAVGLRESTPGLTLAALGGSASPLSHLDLWNDAAFSRADRSQVVEKLVELVADDAAEVKVVLFVDVAEDIDGIEVERPLETLSKSDAVRLVVACEPATLGKAYSGWLSGLRRNRSILVLQPESRLDVDAVGGVKPVLRPSQAFPPGRGIYVHNRRWALVQVGSRQGEHQPRRVRWT